MTKTTSQNFSHRLTRYGALSVAICGINEANSQIIYTDVNPDEGGVSVTSFIDFDHNGLWDAKITQSANAGSQGALINVLRPGNAAIAYYAVPFGRYSYPLALDFDTLISAGNPNWESYNLYQFMNWGNCNYTNSQWCGVTNKYLGIRFKIGSNVHYGWARLDVTNASNWLLKDYAYNTTPGAPINAGQGGSLNINNNELNKIKIVALSKCIGLYNLPETARYNVYNMTGQEVLKGTTDNRDYVIETPTLSSGVYIVELGDAKTNAVVRKKIVLQ